ncbi:phage tail protein [Siminovitchia fortis]|uniref:phage tail protein n=1 Tax=Siminovitchia fortis TaxID=254758 RepID=UPI00119FF84B|nr:phage tail protein [Siminovitchia fortis]
MVKIDNTSIEDLQLCLSERPPIPTPEQDVDHIDIKGRHGSLTKKYGFKDISYSLTFDFLEDVPFKPAFRKAKPVFFNGKKLAFEDDPGIFYKIKSVTIDEAENEVMEYGQFTANFILAPFQYEVNVPTQTITGQTTLTNEGYESEPYIKAHAAGTGKVYINDQVVTIKDINGFIELDSEIMNAYRKTDGYITNLNNHMIGDFPVLAHGKNVIKFDGAITKLEVNPRWRWV